MYRKTYVEINCENIENNIKKIINKYSEYKYYFGIVKNNAYAHGIETVKYMLKAGVNYLAVSSLEEALDLRKIEKEIAILILEPICKEGLSVAADNNLTVTVDNKDYFDEMINSKLKIRFHLKIDAGMNRFGIKNKDDVNYIVNNSNDKVYLEGIYTHLSSGVPGSIDYTNQINKFKELTSDIDLSKIDIVHLDRSLTLQQHPKLEFENGVRLGIIMYGFANRYIEPSLKRKIYNKLTFKNEVKPKEYLSLDTAFKFVSHVLEVKTVKRGEIVGYGGMCDVSENMLVAIVPYGFADFLYNDLNEVVINGKKHKTLVINMDITIIKVDETVKEGDEVEIFGDVIPIRTKAETVNQNVYKLISSVTNRAPRVYKYKNTKKEIKY